MKYIFYQIYFRGRIQAANDGNLILKNFYKLVVNR